MIRLPADYYAAPTSEVRPIVPRWVALGCGTAAAIFLVVGFTGGALVMHSGLGKVMAFVLDMSSSELPPMMTKEVTPAQRQALSQELSQLSKNLETDKTKLTQLQPVLTAMKDAMGDKKITPDEVDKMTKLAHEANQPAPPHK